MSFILFQVEDKPIERVNLPGHFIIFREQGNERFPKIHVEYGYASPCTTFHVYMYTHPNVLKYGMIKKIFSCDQFDVKTNTWTGKINIDPNDIANLFLLDSTRMYFRFNFNVSQNNKIPNLQVLSTCVIGDILQKNIDIQKLPLPSLLKTYFEKNYLEGSEFQNSLKGWFFCETEEKNPLYYFGLPGTHKKMDIHEFTLNKSICTWENLRYISPYDKYIIIRITLHNYFFIHNDIEYIIDIMKKQNFQDTQQRYPYNYFHNKIKAQLIIISDYAPEIFFDKFGEKKWILNNLFVVRKEFSSSPKKMNSALQIL